MKSIFIWCMVCMENLNMTLVPMSHDQNVFNAMLDKIIQKSLSPKQITFDLSM